MKVCSRCKRELDESQFYKNRAKADGLNNECKDCAKQSVKLCRLDNCGGELNLEYIQKLCRRVARDPDIDIVILLRNSLDKFIDRLELEESEV